MKQDGKAVPRERSVHAAARARRWYERVSTCEVPDQHILDTFEFWLRQQSDVDLTTVVPSNLGLLFDVWREKYLDWLWYENLGEVFPRTTEQWIAARGATFGITDMASYKAYTEGMQVT